MRERLSGIFTHKKAPQPEDLFDWEKLPCRAEDPCCNLASLRPDDAYRLMDTDHDLEEVRSSINPGDPDNSSIVVRRITIPEVAVGIGASAGGLAILYGAYRLVKHFWDKRKII